MSNLCFPDDILYHHEHTWLKVVDDMHALVGISDFAQEQLGEVAYVDLPAVNTHFSAGEEFGSVESVKAVNNLYMPVNGLVSAVNDSLDSEPSLVNTSPYEKGWMLKITLDPESGKDNLKSAAEYASLVRRG
jgi:glycine cleavage system H protein